MTFKLATLTSQADFRSAKRYETHFTMLSSLTQGNIPKAFVPSIFSSQRWPSFWCVFEDYRKTAGKPRKDKTLVVFIEAAHWSTEPEGKNHPRSPSSKSYCFCLFVCLFFKGREIG